MSISAYRDMDKSFSARTVPWMVIGGLTDDAVTVEEAIKLGGLDVTVSKRAMTYTDRFGNQRPSSKRFMLARDTDDAEFEVVSGSYEPVQFAEALGILAEINPKVSAAGTLRGGRHGFMVVEVPGSPEVEALAHDDPHRLFGVVRTSHDRTKAIEFAVMPLRGKCMNMLPLKSLTKGAPQRWSIVHTTNAKKRLAEATKMVEGTQRYAEVYGRQVEQLIATPTSRETGEQILRSVLKSAPRTDDAIAAILALWEHDNTVGFQGSAWGLTNAVNSYMQWERVGGNPESRMIGAMQGTTYRYTNQTATRALEAAK